MPDDYEVNNYKPSPEYQAAIQHALDKRASTIRLTFEVELEPFEIGATTAPVDLLANAMIKRILGVAALSYDDLRYKVKTAKWVDAVKELGDAD